MGLRKLSKCMIKNEFEHLRRSVAKAMCKGNTRFIVQSLDHAAVIFPFGAEIVEQEFLVGAKPADLLTPAHLIERLIEVLGNVEWVEHVDGVVTHCGDHFDVGEEPGVLGFARPEALAQGGLGAAHADNMEQAARTG